MALAAQPCEQLLTESLSREASLNVPLHASGLLRALPDVCIDLVGVVQAVGDRSVDFAQVQHRIALDDPFRTDAGVPLEDHTFQRDSCATDADGAVLVSRERLFACRGRESAHGK